MAPLGNLVRLLPLHINELPAHPALESLVSNPSEQRRSVGSSPSQAGKVEASEQPNLISFMEEVLDQATIFIDDTLPATFKEGGLKRSAPATAKVRLLSRNISMAEIQAIPWMNTSMYIPRQSLPHLNISCIFYLSHHSAFPFEQAIFTLESIQVFREIGQMRKDPPKRGLQEGVAMPTTVVKGLQTSMNSTSAYGMIIRSMNSRASQPHFPLCSGILGNPSVHSKCVFCYSISGLERLIADPITLSDNIRQMSLIPIKCWIGLIK